MAKKIRMMALNIPPTPEGYRANVPPAWRDTLDEVRLVFLHFAMRRMGPCYRFDLNLSEKIRTLAILKGEKSREFLHRRIAAELKAVFGKTPEFWFCMEDDDQHRLHIHGSLAIGMEDRLKAREALKKAGGKWLGKGKQFQLNMSPSSLNPDLRGATYASKKLWLAESRTRKMMIGYKSTQRIPSFDGKALSSTLDIKRDAEKLYSMARVLVIAARMQALRALPPGQSVPKLWSVSRNAS